MPNGTSSSSPSSSTNSCTVRCYAGAFVGSTFVGAMMSGASPILVATTFNGALGATVGMIAGSYVTPFDPTGPVAGALLLPAAVQGGFDSIVLGVGLGAVAGAMAVKYMMK